MGEYEIEAFFTDLAVHGKVAASNQNQVFHPILLLYRYVLNVASNILYHAGIPAKIRLFSSLPHRLHTADRPVLTGSTLPGRRYQSERNKDLIPEAGRTRPSSPAAMEHSRIAVRCSALLAHFFQNLFKIMNMCLYKTDAGLLVTERYWKLIILRIDNLFP